MYMTFIRMPFQVLSWSISPQSAGGIEVGGRRMAGPGQITSLTL